MCGRYTLSQPGDIVTELDADIEELEMAPRFNIAPTQNAPIVRSCQTADGTGRLADGTGRLADGTGRSSGRQVSLLRWGLIPFWAKDATIGNRMINARSETVAEKPSFRNAFKNRRCIVLADGFYEWKKTKTGKQPYHIHLVDHRPFALAGLWERWTKGPEGLVESFTILTTDANEKVASLHNRMPVFLDGAARDIWLDPAVTEADRLMPLLRPYDNDRIDFTPVSKLVNSPANNVPECMRPIEIPVEKPGSPFGPLFDLT